MKKRHLLLFAGTVTACIVALGAFALRPTSQRANWTNYMRIHDGMTFDDATGILGKATTNGAGEGKFSHATWVATDNSVIAILFQEDRVFMTQWFDSEKVTVFDRIRRWVHLD